MSARLSLWAGFLAVALATGVILAAGTTSAAGTPGEAGGNYAGPRFVCEASHKVTLQYGGNTYPLDAIEAASRLLVPARAFSIVGAEVKWEGEQRVTVTLGSRAVALAFGDHAVRIIEGGKTTQVAWDLCPRQHNEMAYVPLRPMAEALGFVVTWSPGVARLEGGGPAVTGAAPAECPASKLETALGITVVHAPASTPFGPGVGVTSVKQGGNAERLGLKPRDTIIECNGKRVNCPKDLEAVVAQNQPGSMTPCALTVVRGAVKTTLRCATKTQ